MQASTRAGPGVTGRAAIVRPYRPDDREAVRRIYADTAFFGAPVETYWDDRDLFADLGVSA